MLRMSLVGNNTRLFITGENCMECVSVTISLSVAEALVILCCGVIDVWVGGNEVCHSLHIEYTYMYVY